MSKMVLTLEVYNGPESTKTPVMLCAGNIEIYLGYPTQDVWRPFYDALKKDPIDLVEYVWSVPYSNKMEYYLTAEGVQFVWENVLKNDPQAINY